VSATRPALERLLCNLLDNATRHAESTVTIAVGGTPAAVVIEIRAGRIWQVKEYLDTEHARAVLVD
jgi:hypothetical protein